MGVETGFGYYCAIGGGGGDRSRRGASQMPRSAPGRLMMMMIWCLSVRGLGSLSLWRRREDSDRCRDVVRRNTFGLPSWRSGATSSWDDGIHCWSSAVWHVIPSTTHGSPCLPQKWPRVPWYSPKSGETGVLVLPKHLSPLRPWRVLGLLGLGLMGCQWMPRWMDAIGTSTPELRCTFYVQHQPWKTLRIDQTQPVC